ncbi:glycerophosphodiester phosphodiesterase [Parasphingopyxis sp. GrpM-11]|uniref:glycerophosphodiester phosphodiesterase n=2 Tax=Parasphingopyxis marina TaxID=2761622 RepID=A0A842HX16_9SPHN|nr:glycerophosphodiester phosphodiesterase [Parasphingopyxis marina]
MAQAPTDDAALPLIIAHRGASAERPEHTLEAYQLAIDQGADYIEPDFVLTRDGVFVARHEHEISGTTDIADHPEFADRHTTKTYNGEAVTGWFTEDFTLAELRTLRAREPLAELRPASAAYDGQFAIATLEEILALVQRQDRPVGLMPELKHPSYFRSIGMPMEEAFIEQLAAAGYASADDPIFIQAFEIAPLVQLNALTDIRLVQLVGDAGGPSDAPDTTYADMVSPAGLAEIAAYADILGPPKNRVIARTEDGALGEPTSLVADAHAAGLLVVPWTFRPENHFLPTNFRVGNDPRADGRPSEEMIAFFRAGVDGIFTDDPEEGIYARYLLERPGLMRELAREAQENGEN